MADLNPYISFKNNAREALDFYQSVLGGQVMCMTFGDLAAHGNPMGTPEADNDLVMHGQLVTDTGLMIMAADTGDVIEHVPATQGMSIALTGSGEDLDYIQAAFDAISAEATHVYPFEKAPWGDVYGMCVDKFGISWMFNVHK
ncbi:MAG: VOC family protein [Cellulomonadaceae bacterium]|jgi:PhnB protein|nr:VOC family protein [Cellulomonadaceae bacterium]